MRHDPPHSVSPRRLRIPALALALVLVLPLAPRLQAAPSPALGAPPADSALGDGRSSYRVDKTVFWLGAGFILCATVGLVFLYLNIRRRRPLERSLRMTEAKFRQLFNGAGDAIYIYDCDLRILEMNRAACDLTGYSRERLLGLTLTEINPPSQVAESLERVEMLREKGSALFESLLLTGGGEVIPVEVSARMIEYGDQPAVLAILRDITRRKEIELREKTRLQILEEMACGAPLEDLLAYIVRFVEQ